MRIEAWQRWSGVGQSFPGGRDRPEGIAKKDWEIRGPPDAPRVYFMGTFDDTGQGLGRDPSSGEVGVLLCWHCPFNRTSTCLGAIPTAFSHDEAEVSDSTPREHVYIMGESNIKAALSPLAWACGKEPAYEGRAASSFPTKGFTRSFCSIQFALLVLFSQLRRSGRQASSDLSRF